ncbi:uncharacterized protein [Montipora foliosa]|uniref:uncharacterized protein n=1 Tax=Montipora foliosa TaxID=591990 RepID=UPI0035F1F069
MSSTARSTRDRAPKYSIVLSNVLAVVFRPTSSVVQVNSDRDSENLEDLKPPHQLNGLEVFDAFKEANKSTLLTRLTESLGEIRLKGWVFPFTLLIKGPHEDIEVIKEAWRRHFLRSPENLSIKDIGVVSSVGMEVIQQAPFLPLTMSLMETISALNSSQLTATKQSITEYLAKTYQYVHVPKLNVIHDCLGILIKEGKIHQTDDGYFVSVQKPVDKIAVDAPKEKGDSQESKDSHCVTQGAVSKGMVTKSEKAKKKTKCKETQNKKAKTSEKDEESVESEKGSEGVRPKTVTTENEEKLLEKDNENNKTPSEMTSESGASEKSDKKLKKQKKGVFNRISCFVKGKSFPSSDIEVTKPKQTESEPSPLPTPQSISRQAIIPPTVQDSTANSIMQAASFRTQRALSAPVESPYPINANVSSQETAELVDFRKGENNRESPKSRQLLRTKSLATAEPQRSALPVRVMRSNSFAAPNTKATKVTQTATDWAKVERPYPMNANVSSQETAELVDFKKGENNRDSPKSRQLLRTKSFVTTEPQRPALPVRVMRSNSFTAPNTKATKVTQTTTDCATGNWDRHLRMSYGNIVRNSPIRQTIHVSRPSSCNIGIVRPLRADNQRTISRSNSVKKGTSGKKGGSLSPPSTLGDSQSPRSISFSNGRSKGRANNPVVRSRSFTEPGMMRLTNRQIFHRATIAGPYLESPLQQLLASKPHGYLSPPSPAVRVTVQPKGRHFAPGKRSTTSPKRTPLNSPVRKPHPVSSKTSSQKQMPSTPRRRLECSSPVCYDTAFINNRVENCACTVGINTANVTKSAPFFLQNNNYKHVSLQPDEGSSDHIYLEEMTPTASELTLMEDEYTEETGTNNERGIHKQATEEGINDSLTFIGII